MTHSLSQRTKRTLAAAATVGLLGALAACGGSDSGDSDGTIVIGYSAGLSGGAAEYGVNVQNGLQMAIDELNEEGVEIDGTEYEIRLESLDDQYQPGTTGTNVQRLVEREGAAVVFIPHAGGIKAAQELNSDRTEFLIGAYSSDPAILDSGNELTVMIPPSFDSYIPPFMERVWDGPGSRLGLMATASEFGQQWTDLLSEEWEAAGGEVLAKNNIDYGTVTDFAGPVAKTLSGNPDVILVGGPSQPTALIIEEARQQGFEGAFLINDQAKYDELEVFTDPENLNNSVGIMPLELFEGTAEFIQNYQEKFSSDQPVNADIALNYQALPVFIEAMKEAGTIDDPQAIREAMPDALDAVEGVFFVPDSITDNGHLQADGLQAAFRNENGEYEPFDIEQTTE